MQKKKPAVRRKKKKNSCTPPLQVNEAAHFKKTKLHEERMQWIKKNWRMQQADPYVDTAIIKSTLSLVGSWQLVGQGVDLVPSTPDYPPDFNPRFVENYSSILRAFSRTFGPNLFEEMGKPDPFPTGEPYWSNFFFQIAPQTRYGVLQVNIAKGGCFGEVGRYTQGGPMTIYDCTSESDIFHEIGHAVMDDGIMKFRKPLYFSYATGRAPNGVPEIIDAKKWLDDYFGKQNLDQGNDIDGVKIGFVTNYAVKTKNEDFAETFKNYVYNPSLLWDKITRQEAMGSRTLSAKAGLIAALYKGLWFKDGGIPAEWPGYSL